MWCLLPLPLMSACTLAPAAVAATLNVNLTRLAEQNVTNPADISDMLILLKQKAAITNWDAFAATHNVSGWSADQPTICAWTGVICSQDRTRVSELNIECRRSAARTCTVPVEGTLIPELTRIEQLAAIRADNHRFSGPLPAEWGDPSASPDLYYITLRNNTLTGELPREWGTPGSFPYLGHLELSRNKLSGNLPSEWAAAGALRGLVYAYLDGNQLAGPLPDAWGLDPALPGLEFLHLQSNALTGTIPASWGDPEGFPQVTELRLEGNPGLRGGVPDSLDAVVCAPPAGTGTTPCVCTADPKEAPASDTEAPAPTPKCSLANNTVASGAASTIIGAAPPPPAEDGGGLSAGTIGAIVGGVMGGLAVISILAGFALLRRSQRPRRLAEQQQTSGDAEAAVEKDAPSHRQLPSPFDVALSPSRGPAAAAEAAASAAAAANDAVMLDDGESEDLDQDPVLTFVKTKLAAAATQRSMALALSGGLSITRRQSAAYAAALARGASAAQAGAVAAGPSGKGSAMAASGPLPAIDESLPPPAALQPAPLSPPPPPPPLPTPISRPSVAVEGSEGSKASNDALAAEWHDWEVAWQDLRLCKRIGSGSFGRVYLAHFLATPVAVKVLINREAVERNASLELPRGLMAQLQEEASVMARMRHPNIVSFMGICTLPPCILTEYCSQGSLFDVLRRASRDPARAAELTWLLRLSLAFDAARGLLYLHRRSPPIIHRDVKSPNLLVDEGWHLKVCDFNMSSLLGGSGGGVGGDGATNPLWLAPEVLRGQPATAASDVYALGLVLYELLTWRLPWGAQSPFAIRRAVLEGERPAVPPRAELPGPATATWPGLDAYMQLMRDCWAALPGDRPSMADVVIRLGALLGGPQGRGSG